MNIKNKVEIAIDLLNAGLISKTDYCKLFNLSQEEIDALVQETLDLANQMQEPKQMDLPFTGYGIFTPTELKKECDHEFVLYQGLKETFEYCKTCDVKK